MNMYDVTTHYVYLFNIMITMIEKIKKWNIVTNSIISLSEMINYNGFSQSSDMETMVISARLICSCSVKLCFLDLTTTNTYDNTKHCHMIPG